VSRAAEETLITQAAETSASKDDHKKRPAKPAAAVQVYTPAELKAFSPEPLEYVARLIAARGMLTLVDGAPKTAGKTNLILHGIRAVRQQEPFLAHATKQVSVLLVTEENARTITLALERVGLLATDGFYIVPWSSLAGQKWGAIVDSIEKICVDRKIGWLITDTFFGVAGLGGEEENKAGVVDEATVPLRDIIGRLNLAGTITRHERKSGGSVGESGRGSSALTGSVDAIVQLKRLSANYGPNTRQLDVSGRAEQVLLNIELVDNCYVVHEAGTDLRTSTLELTEQLAETLRMKPEASIRDLADFLGITRMRVQRLLKQDGWIRGANGWQRVDL
jgi:AAA domain-containing protein